MSDDLKNNQEKNQDKTFFPSQPSSKETTESDTEKEVDDMSKSIAPPPPAVTDFSPKINQLREKGKQLDKRKKLYFVVGVILLLAGGVLAGGYFYRAEIADFLNMGAKEKVACLLDARACPDGSTVSRVLPDCEFAECPAVEEKDYYEALEDQCEADICCLESLQVMRENDYKKAGENDECPDGYQVNALWCGESSLKWCEPEECAQEGEMISTIPTSSKALYKQCCQGLKTATPTTYYDDQCIQPPVEPESAVCINCPNEECGSGENKCNCPEDCEEVEEEIEEIDTSDWQTYRNEEHGFEFKYPKNWPQPVFQKFNSIGWNGESLEQDSWRLDVGEINEGGCEGTNCYDLYFDGFLFGDHDKLISDLRDDELVIIKEQKEVNGNTVVVYDSGGICGYRNALIFGNQTIRFTARCGADVPDLANSFDQIFSTFKFIEPTTADTANWQTYRNEENRYNLKHPDTIAVSHQEDFIKVTSGDQGLYTVSIIETPGPSPETMDMELFESKTVSFDGYNVVRESFRGALESNKDQYYVRVVLAHKDTLYQVDLNEDNYQEAIDLFDQMVSTYKWLDDSDSDGLFDDEEAEYGTDPNNPDSDGDGYLDGEEVDGGYNPLGEGML